MKVNLCLDYLCGYLCYGHYEVDIDQCLSQEEKEEFLSLNERNVKGEILTEDEIGKLDDYRDVIIGSSDIIVDDFEIEDTGEINNWDVFVTGE